MASDSKHRPVYVISVAAELVDMHPQTLRLYERKGLIRPGRSTGKTRLYSERDIEHLREIRRLTQELGVNLAGVEEVMRLQYELDDLQGEFEAEIARIEGEIRDQAKPRALPAPGEQPDPRDRPVYVISIAAELVDMHPQTLRLYERKELIRPGRSVGKTRLYSERDIEHLREIRRLTQELGVNLAGVEEVMRLQYELDDLQGEFEAEIARIEGEIRDQAKPRALPAPGEQPDPRDRPVYVISIAAELVDMHPQTLRLYERKELIRPGRSVGKTRLYSERDIEHLREIRRLTQELGVNLAGVEEIMRLRHELDSARFGLEGNVQRIQQDISERMTTWRTLAAPAEAEEDGAAVTDSEKPEQE